MPDSQSRSYNAFQQRNASVLDFQYRNQSEERVSHDNPGYLGTHYNNGFTVHKTVTPTNGQLVNLVG